MAAVVPARTVTVGDVHACAIAISGGEVWCWGSNDDGQLGVTPSVEEPPTRAGSLDGMREIAAGRTHTCALDADGRVLCWGANTNQQLSYVGASSATPVVVSLPAKATAVHAGSDAVHVCATLEDGSVWCWGSSSAGQLGRGPDAQPGLPGPMLIPCS